jgi:hypothetical protein
MARLKQFFMKEQNVQKRIRLGLLYYNKDLRSYDKFLTKIIESNPKTLSSDVSTDLIEANQFFEDLLPQYLEKIIELKRDGKLASLDDHSFYSLFDLSIT